MIFKDLLSRIRLHKLSLFKLMFQTLFIRLIYFAFICTKTPVTKINFFIYFKTNKGDF